MWSCSCAPGCGVPEEVPAFDFGVPGWLPVFDFGVPGGVPAFDFGVPGGLGLLPCLPCLSAKKREFEIFLLKFFDFRINLKL